MRTRYELSEHAEIIVTVDDRIEFSIPLQVQAENEAAQHEFQIESRFKGLVHSSEFSKDFDRIVESGVMSREEVIQRLWQQQVFGLVYQLRESSDFAYEDH